MKLSDTAARQQFLNCALERALTYFAPLPEHIAELDALVANCRDTPEEGYTLALSVARSHAACDASWRLDEHSARLLALQADPHQARNAFEASSQRDAWQIVVANGSALVALHGEAPPQLRDELCHRLLRVLVSATADDTALQRLRLRSLTTALHFSQAIGSFPLRLETDAIAADCIAKLPQQSAEIGHWYAERALIEIFTVRTELRVQTPVSGLLEQCQRALETSPNAMTQFRHIRNEFEWARVENDPLNAKRALVTLRRAHTDLGPGRRTLSIVLLRAESAFALDAGDNISAERFARDAIAVADDIGASSNLRMAIWTTLLMTLVVQERAADAAIAATKASGYAISQHKIILGTMAQLLTARAQWETDFTAAIDCLRAGMQAARAANYSQFFMNWPPLAAWLAARSLDHQIESAFVTDLISRRQLSPPPDAGISWPWAVRVRLLGGSTVQGSGVDLAGTVKAQQKPIDIVQLLAIAGPKGMDRANLARVIYGSALLDSPATLNMAISRARRALGDDTLIDSQNGRVRLDARRVYVDLWAMQALTPASDDEAHWQCRHLLEIYAGPLLNGSSNADKHRIAAATARDRFVALIVELSAKTPINQVVDILYQAIARESTAEPLYRALIERLTERGDAAEAVEVYQRCELALSQTYGVAPSERTQRLIETVRKNSAPRSEILAMTQTAKTRPAKRTSRKK
jgi:DNA-binding SARP family transcriptional activator